MKPRVLCGLLCLATACATPASSSPAPARGSYTAFAEHASHVAAADEMARAAQAQADGSPGVLNKAQIRAQPYGLTFSGEESYQVGLRLQLDRPWSVAALSRSLRAGADQSQFLAQVARAESEAAMCEESVHARALAERRTLLEQRKQRLELALAWIDAFREGGGLDPVTVERAGLIVRRHLLEREAEPVAYRMHPTLGALPDVIAVPQGALDRDPQRIFEGIHEAHPKVRAQLFEAKRQTELGKAERSQYVPWFDMVEVDYRRRGDGLNGMQAQLAVGIPLDDGSRGRARRADALSRSAELEAEGVAATLTHHAEVALSALDAIEHDAEQLKRLKDDAVRADELAARLLQGREGPPDRAVQLVVEAHSCQAAIIDAKERAGEAACALKLSTGRDYTSWPRVALVAEP